MFRLYLSTRLSFLISVHRSQRKTPSTVNAFSSSTNRSRCSVPEPQLDTFVFCKGSVGAFQLDDFEDEIVDLIADDIYVLRYKSIKPLIETRQIDLV